ncbi:DNA repair protein [Lactarius vividus]|nr:DNA repair protein [Lactarius vividus]
MVSPPSPTTSNSSALFGSDDSSFLEALGAAVLPGDVTCQAQNEDARHLSSPPPLVLESSGLESPPCAQPTNAQPDISSDDEPEQPTTRTPTHAGLHPQHPPFVISDDNEPTLLQLEPHPLAQSSYRKHSDTYGASRFGEFGEYMRRKRAKLQIQNAEMRDTPRGEASGSQPFKGLSIHINGWTEPSVQELRKLIVENGGIYQAYIDKKTLVTHIITCSLTPAKVREFKHMKVVKPEWLVQSAKAGVLLPWQDFIFLPGGRPESAHGRLAQSSLTEFSSSKPRNNTLEGARLSEENPLSSDRNPSAPLHLLQAPSLHPSPPTAPVPNYAKHESNPAAQRAMADPAWRAAHTSAAPGFIAGYYANSRLHHLSMWKAELRTLVVEAQERAERGDFHTASRTSETGAGVSMRGAALVMKNPLKGKEKAGHKAERVIMHVDFDAFFVSAGLVTRPHLRGKPVVVCHSQYAQGGASSTSDIASASYEARKFGIKNGMNLQQARRLCPDVVTIPYEFERYRQLSLEFYTILMSHADDLQAVSVDEALIDVTSTVAQMRVVPTGTNDDGDSTSTDIAKEFAESMRGQIKAATGCIASIGIAPNIMLARLATRRAKPAGSFHLLPAAFRDLLPDLDIQDLHGFGRAARDKASEKLGTTNLGELAGRNKAALCDALGNAMGETLYNSIRGRDDRKLESDKPRKSVSCDINYGIRFEHDDQVEAFIHQMSEEVAHRLDAINMKGRSLTLKIMKRDPSAPVEPPKFMGHGQCVTYNKQSALVGPDGRATSDPRLIGSLSWRLLRTLSIPPRELRGISIHIQKLDAYTGSIPAPGHAHLPFRPAPNPTASGSIVGPAPKARAPLSEPSKGPVAGADLPSFSQVDMSVFEALPEDIRKELETEYERRSAPAPNKPEPPADPIPRANSVIPARGGGNDRPRGRGISAVSSRGRRGSLGRNQTRGATSWGLRPRGRGRGRGGLLAFPPAPAPMIHVKPGELEELGIDAEVFAALPVRIQREQLAAARGARVRPSQQPVRPSSPLRPLQRLEGRWAPPQGPHEYIPPPPPPRARFAEAERPVLRRGDADTSPVVEGVDVRRVVRAWVELFVRHVPHKEDVALVGGYLVRCVVTDVGTERAVGVMRWWGALLRRRWAVWEHADERDEEPEPGEDIRAEVVGMAWWRAYREVGDSLNAVVRKRFGGSLKFR